MLCGLIVVRLEVELNSRHFFFSCDKLDNDDEFWPHISAPASAFFWGVSLLTEPNDDRLTETQLFDMSDILFPTYLVGSSTSSSR